MMTWQLYTALVLYCLLLLFPVACSNTLDIDAIIDDTVCSVTLASSVVVDATILITGLRSRRFVPRKRKCVEVIFKELGPYHVRRSYRMQEATFWKLNSLLLPYLPKQRKRKRGWTPNGAITSAIKLSMAICYFAGASPHDLMSSHGIGYNNICNGVWDVVDAVNLCPQLQLKFPGYDEQHRISSRFRSKSDVGFDNCVGCVDGILIWIAKPSIKAMIECNIGAGNYFCGRKKNLV